MLGARERGLGMFHSPSNQPTDTAPVRYCASCLEPKPLTDFRRRRADGDARMNECRSCHSKSERRRRMAKRSRAGRQAVNRELARLKAAKSERQVALVCEKMVQGFGGLDAFARAWKGCVDRDVAKGGYAACRHFLAMIRLIQHCDTGRPAYSRMSDDELIALAERYAE